VRLKMFTNSARTLKLIDSRILNVRPKLKFSVGAADCGSRCNTPGGSIRARSRTYPSGRIQHQSLGRIKAVAVEILKKQRLLRGHDSSTMQSGENTTCLVI
jgi:hypothetical protein